VIIVTLLALVGVLAGMSIMGTAPRRSAREFVGAVLLLASVIAIPVGAALATLSS
jgi:hypothetical protein